MDVPEPSTTHSIEEVSAGVETGTAYRWAFAFSFIAAAAAF